MGAAAVPALTGALGSEDVLVRRRAAWILEQLAERSGGAATLLPLLFAVRDDDEEVRYWAAWGLGKLGGKEPDLAQILRAAITSEGVERVRDRLRAGLR